MSNRLRSIHRRLSRAALIATAVVSAPYLASAGWWVGWLRSDELLGIEFMAGCLCVADSDPNHDIFGFCRTPGFHAGVYGNQLIFLPREYSVSGQRLHVTPLWPIPVGLAALTVALFATLRRCPAGACPGCGYDLRGLRPDHPTGEARCPECGRTATG